MPKLPGVLKKIVEAADPENKGVVVHLAVGDYTKVQSIATLNHETVGEWISSLVNTALQP